MPTASANPVANTQYEIIIDAMLDAGIIGEGDTPNSEQLANNMRRLNKLINYFQTKGLKLFVQEDVTVTLVQGQGQYVFGPVGPDVVMAKPRRIIEAYYTDSNQTRRPLILMSRQEWDTLSTITNKGTVTSFFPDKQLATINLNLWLVPDAVAATGRVHCIVDEQIPNFALITDTMAFPPEWSLALEWGLAHQLSTGQPQSIIDRCKENAFYYQAELEDWDVEDAATMFQPDQRGQFVGRRFN